MADRLSRRLETGDDAEVGDGDAMSLLIIVRRGQTERFERVTRTLGRTAEVIWDRRVAERRRPDTLAAVDRRRRERRLAVKPAVLPATGQAEIRTSVGSAISARRGRSMNPSEDHTAGGSRRRSSRRRSRATAWPV